MQRPGTQPPVPLPCQVWNGSTKEPEHSLLDAPVAITSFFSEQNAKLPSLAVASGSHVYIYRNLRPYFKFALPPEDVNPQEQEIWCALHAARPPPARRPRAHAAHTPPHTNSLHSPTGARTLRRRSLSTDEYAVGAAVEALARLQVMVMVMVM